MSNKTNPERILYEMELIIVRYERVDATGKRILNGSDLLLDQVFAGLDSEYSTFRDKKYSLKADISDFENRYDGLMKRLDLLTRDSLLEERAKLPQDKKPFISSKEWGEKEAGIRVIKDGFMFGL